jgi:hypothetical protein
MTSRLFPAVGLVLFAFASGCATLRPVPPERNAAVRLAGGLSAYDDGRYADAFVELAWVTRSCPNREAGLHAKAALAALELDPRNSAGRPGVGTRLLADLILDPRTPERLRPLIESTYLLGLGLGAPPGRPSEAVPPPGAREPGELPEPDRTEEVAPPTPPPPTPPGAVQGCGPLLGEASPAATLPTLPGPSLSAMLDEAEAERDRLAERTAAMDNELSRLREELAQARAELERIRRTLRP